MNSSEKSTGGYWMLFGIFMLLAIPMVIGHFTLATGADETRHADAGPITAAN